MLTSNKQPTDALAALTSLQSKIRLHQLGIVLTYSIASLILWVWFYHLSGWLDAQLIQNLEVAFPWQKSILLIVASVSLYAINAQIRFMAAKKICSSFYHAYFHELNERRWSLIRTKPATAWQDITFRHLPTIEQYLLDYMPQRKLILLIPVLVLFFIAPLSWLAALILFMTLPLIPLFMWLVGHGTVAAQNKHISSLNRLGSFFSDRIMGVDTVRTLGSTTAQLKAFDRVSLEQNRRLADVVRLAFLSGSVLDFFSTVSMALIAVFIGFSLLGEINIGFWGHAPTLHHGLFILIVSPAFFSELKKLGKLYHVKAEASAAVSQWQHTLTWQPLAGNAQLEESFQSLTIENAEIFGFNHEKLLDIESLSIFKNERVLITGASGSGKTVLLDVLAGLREVSASTLQVNKTESDSLKLLQQSIFYVGQQAVFFDGTLFENMGLNKHSREQVAAAIVQVGMGNWLQQQAEGLDFAFGDHIQLSGGQKQKLALARLALFETEIVLLDEPLAHLSIDEQTSVLAVLSDLTETRTSVWISHKPLPTLKFDKTWHIDEQTVVQRT